MKNKHFISSVIIAMALVGCATKKTPVDEVKVLERIIASKPVVVDTACKWVHPIMISKKDDVLSAGTARQILNHNETWSRNCPQAK